MCGAFLSFSPLNGRHDMGIRIPAQHGIFAISGLSVFDIGPALEKVSMAEDAGQLASDGAVDVFHDVEVGGEEDVEVALMDIRGCHGDIATLISCLDDGGVDAGQRAL